MMALTIRSEEHTSELQSLRHLVCRLLLEKKFTVRAPHRHAQELGPLAQATVADAEWLAGPCRDRFNAPPILGQSKSVHQSYFFLTCGRTALFPFFAHHAFLPR